MLFSLLQEHTTLFSFSVAFLGLIIGSFLNVVIVRIPHMVLEVFESDPPSFNLLWPASHCPKCQVTIHWFDNIPILSFIWLKGQCRHCQQKISPRYPFVEALTAILSYIVALHFGPTLYTAWSLMLVWALIALAMIDFEHTILPDNITLPFLWVGLFANTFDVFTSAKEAILGAIIGYLSLWIIFWVFKLLTRKEGMGYGDFKLLALLGAWLGWQALPLIILVASFLGSVVGISLILLKKKDRNSAVPFGPFLAIAGYSVLLLFPHLNTFYFKLFAL